MKYIKTKIKAVIFDLDGTIVKTEHLWEKGTESYLISKGVNTSAQEHQDLLASFSGQDVIKCATIMKDIFSLEDSIEQIIKDKQKAVMSLFESGLQVVDGFPEFHKQLQDHKIPNGIATNADDVALAHLKRLVNLESYFNEHIYNISHVEKPKPDPALFLHVAKKLGAAPSECIVFEDSLPGLTAARAAGMKIIAIKNNRNAKHTSLAHDAVDNYHEATEALKRILP